MNATVKIQERINLTGPMYKQMSIRKEKKYFKNNEMA
jgi:hypothetical protein